MAQESVSGQRGSSVLGNVVHPCREVDLLIAVSTVMDVQTYILILYNYKWILEICGSGIAFSQGVEEGYLGINVTTCLLIINCYYLLFYMLQDSRSCVKMLVFDRLGFPPLFWHSAV